MNDNDNGNGEADAEEETYNFIGSEEQKVVGTEIDFNVVGNRWDLGSHSTADEEDQKRLSGFINETMEQLDDDIDSDMKAVLQDASELVSDTKVHQFECPVEECGLGHSHPDYKHDIRKSFNVINDFASQMQFCPYCHCGVNELSMLMSLFPYIDAPVFEDQEKFEAVLEVEPEILEALYRRFKQDEMSVRMAVRTVASERGIAEGDIAGHGIRPELNRFFTRRKNIDKAAEAAPIAEETRNTIDRNRQAAQDVIRNGR
jgi:hypothetical protein